MTTIRPDNLYIKKVLAKNILIPAIHTVLLQYGFMKTLLNFIAYYMNMEKPFILLVLLVRFVAVIFCDGVACEVSSVGYTLVGHSFKVVPVYSRMECIQRCAISDQCVSGNVQALTASMLCELNDKTREAHPGDFKERKKSTYFEILRETFDKHSGSICASGLYCGYAVAKCGVYECRCMGSASAAAQSKYRVSVISS